MNSTASPSFIPMMRRSLPLRNRAATPAISLLDDQRSAKRRSSITQRQRAASAVVWALAFLGLVFLSLPIGALLVRAIQNRAWEITSTVGVLIPGAVLLSLTTTLATLALTVLFGTPLAYILARRSFPLRRLINVLIELPIVLPPAVAGLALLITFGRRGFIGASFAMLGITLPFTPAAVVLAQTFVAAPFFIRAAQIAFTQIPPELEDAARMDGAGGWALFQYVTLPLALPALMAGLVLCWARALGEFGATLLFAGSLQGRTQTMPLLIYNAFEQDLDAAIWTGLLLVGIALLALLIARSFSRKADSILENLE